MVSAFGLFTARTILGLSLASHGTQKKLGWFGGPGPEAAAKYFESLGFTPGNQHVDAAATSEMVAGVMLALGLGGPVAPALALSVMTVAMAVSAEQGFYGQNGGLEFPMLYALGALILGSTGYGPLSLDRALGLDKALGKWPLLWLGIAAGVGSGIAVYTSRKPPPQAEKT
jgi:putative oxidoreductase